MPDAFLDALRDKYTKRGRAQEFREEEGVLADLIPKLRENLDKSGFELDEPLNIGSTAIVSIVKDKHLRQRRALKLPRPRLGKLSNIIAIIRTERERLSGLSHQNVIRVYYAGEVRSNVDSDAYTFPYFVMEYLESVNDLDKHILENRTKLTAHAVIEYLQGILNGLSYLHAQKIIHCDIKPGNLLIAQKRLLSSPT